MLIIMRPPHGRAKSSLKKDLLPGCGECGQQTASSKQLSERPRLLKDSCLRSYIFLDGLRSLMEGGDRKARHFSQHRTLWMATLSGWRLSRSVGSSASPSAQICFLLLPFTGEAPNKHLAPQTPLTHLG